MRLRTHLGLVAIVVIVALLTLGITADSAAVLAPALVSMVLFGIGWFGLRRQGFTSEQIASGEARPVPRWARALPWILVFVLVVVFVVARATA